MRTLRCLAGLMAGLSILVTTHAQTADLLETRSAGQIASLASMLNLPDGVIPLDFGVAKYRVTYTIDYLGLPHEVSGALFVPVDEAGDAVECAMPTHTYMHGTMFRRDDAPSYDGFEGELGFIMATGGAVCLMPDYLGLGSSDDVIHPYCHAESEADAGIGILAAVEALQDELGLGLNGQHYVSGYSQGGHASMAMAKRMQEDPDAGFPLAAAAPMSGPYDMSASQLPIGMAEEQYSNPAYLAYILLSWQQTYGNLYVDLGELFQEPYASGITDFFDGETGGAAINDFLAGPTVDIVQPGAFDAIMAEDHPFFLALQANDVYQWVPESPLKMYYCTQDEQVFYDNALVAEAWMNDNGATAVTTVNGGPLDHGGCALLAILGGTVWINAQADLCNPTAVAESEEAALSWSPMADGAQVKGLAPGTSWTLHGLDGRITRSGIANGGQEWMVLPHGLSLLRTADGRVLRMVRD